MLGFKITALCVVIEKNVNEHETAIKCFPSTQIKVFFVVRVFRQMSCSLFLWEKVAVKEEQAPSSAHLLSLRFKAELVCACRMLGSPLVMSCH